VYFYLTKSNEGPLKILCLTELNIQDLHFVGKMGKKNEEALKRFREAKEKGVSRTSQLEEEEEEEGDVYRIVDEDEYGYFYLP
jgi:hypothetical protein